MNSLKTVATMITAILLLYLAIPSSLCASLTSSTKEAVADGRPQQQSAFKVPFLILMSSEDVSVAQMPLIDDGSISVVYRLVDGPAADAEAATRVADAEQQREYEQQMPRQTQSTSLGKSEWSQQIAAGSSKSIPGREEEVSVGNEDAVAAQQAKKGTSEEAPDRRLPPRKRRDDAEGDSATATSDHGNRGSVSASSSGSNNGPSGDAAMESPSNVTSAQFGSSAEAVGSTNSSAVEAETKRRAPPEGRLGRGGGGNDSGASNRYENGVQFSNFDVHMWLGYAFVADSTGRIHRFRLSGFEDRGSSSSSSRDFENLQASHANTADLASNDLAQQKGEHKTYPTARPNITNDGNNDSSPLYSGDDDDANKVTISQSGGSAVTHEQSGRHPTASGGSAFENQNGEFASSSGFSTSVESNVATASTANAKQEQRRRIDNYKPTIIWSRTKHDADQQQQQSSQFAAAPDSATPDRSTTLVGTGALPGNQQMVAKTKGGKHHQMANESEHMESGELDEDDDESPATAGSPISGRECTGGVHLKTEIAVDWLNNLLFVLDKCRLLVVDLDGNNELVLIDDFDDYSRPTEIKVDPVEGRLFWLQVGKFHNTIYKFDLSMVNRALERVAKSRNNNLFASIRNDQQISTDARRVTDEQTSELVDLTSRHYAHPIITNLPLSAKLFTIDHKHSRIYVPLPAISPNNEVSPTNSSNAAARTTPRDDAEIFASQPESDNIITHLNSTSNSSSIDGNPNDKNCTPRPFEAVGQILAYNLDGTDVGPLRGAEQTSHLSGTEDMLDLALDSENVFLYWLTNDGKELFEEYKTHSTFYSAQHSLDGKKYLKLLHFDNGSANQPRLSPRVKIRLSDASSANRWVRSDGNKEQQSSLDDQLLLASGLNIARHRSDPDVSRFSRNAPYMILGIISLVVLTVYLVYAFVFYQHRSARPSSNAGSDLTNGSIGGDSHIGSAASNQDGSAGLMNISGTSRGFGTKYLNHESAFHQNAQGSSSFGNDRTVDSCDLESSTNYNGTNAIDEHYRDALNNRAMFGAMVFETNPLANLGEWPTNMNDMSNKLYVPVEVLQDDALASINRISIDQLEIARHSAPLGEGHFGKVLQGTLTCSLTEHSIVLNKSHQVVHHGASEPVDPSSLMEVQHRRILIPSSVSSGHGSSSTSSDFITATSYAEATNGDYLTPKSQCESSTSAASDYLADQNLGPDSCISYVHSSVGTTNCSGRDGKEKEPSVTVIATRLKVAIKKLKDGASTEEKRDFLHEAKLLASFDHPNIVQLIGICLDRGSTLIVMELMLGGDLIRYMKENTPRDNDPDNLTYDDLLAICLDIVNGCCYLEELKHIHRDLAARNCLVSSWKKEERVVKLADFGLARDIYKDSYYKKLNDSAMPLKWMAYECLTQQKFTIMSDVWSFGVVIWEVMSFCQEKPYDNVQPCIMKEHLASGARLRKPDNCNEDIYRLMRSCWQLDPDDRPTFQECRAVLIEIRNRMSK